MPSPSLSTSKVVLRSLYRSLLRASAPFSAPSPTAAAYASLLHRSGVAHDWEECVHKLDKRRDAALLEKSNKEKGAVKENKIPKSWAQNLSRSYSDLQDEYALRKEYFEQRYGAVDDENLWDDDESAMDLAVGTSSYYRQTEDYHIEEDPKFILFRHLLREWFAGGGDGQSTDASGGETTSQWPRQWTPNETGYYENGKIKQVPLMRFPSQISSDCGPSLRELIQREFRAPTVEERLRMQMNSKEEKKSTPSSTTGSPAPKETYLPSSFIDNEIRIQTAFYTIMELNRKLAWAEKIGFHSSSQQATKYGRNQRRLVQAAKGVSQLPLAKTKDIQKELLESGGSKNNGESETKNDSESDLVRDKTSSPLECGTYLIAHPLMTGYFEKSVIVLLDHAEEIDKKSSNNPTEGGSGGTYGLIINRLALQPELGHSSQEILRQKWEEKKYQLEKEEAAAVSGNDAESMAEPAPGKASSPNEAPSKIVKATSHNISRPIPLLQAITSDDLPDTICMAFGDSPVREGGPVNLSLQMIHRKEFEMKNDGSEPEDLERNGGPASTIGGTLLGEEHCKPNNSDDSIYFGGDIMKASYAVLDGTSDRDDFSFIIGASCWAPGQLANEIERGCWLPFHGPPQMAMTGMADLNDAATMPSELDETEKERKLSIFPPRPSNAVMSSVAGSAANGQSGQPVTRPVGDLWLSIMCALGEGEADLAYLMLDGKNVKDEFGDACDNFHR